MRRDSMKKRIAYIIPVIVLIILLSIFVFNSTKQADTEDKGEQVIYYVPHQDDEVITFGVSIYHHLQQGDEVHVVLLTDGSSSGVRKQMDLTEEEFIAARNREFDHALGVLGVDEENIVKKGYKDGALTVEQVEAIITEYDNKYPEASHKTFSYYDPHPDHANAGKALKNLQDQGVLTDATYYFGNNFTPTNVEIKQDPYDESYYPFIKEASRSYQVQDEANGMYGIGWKSVPDYFKELEANPVSRYHE